MMASSQQNFQKLLRELFQFDCADLDFGIYRIMNYKRQVIEQWINEGLPSIISEELQQGALAEQEQAQKALQAARQKVLAALGEDALDAEGNLAEKYRETKAGKEYLEAQAKAHGARFSEALEAGVYNHLYTFFSRYWQDGDFISRRHSSNKDLRGFPTRKLDFYLKNEVLNPDEMEATGDHRANGWLQRPRQIKRVSNQIIDSLVKSVPLSKIQEDDCICNPAK